MLPVISWWLVIELIGLLALPLTWRLFARLPGRAYPLTKVLGLLLVSYALWLGATFHILPNNLGGALVSLALVAALSAYVGREGLRQDADGARPLLTWLRAHRGLVIASELLFLVVFVAWSAFRAFNPDIAGTEKPMEFAFINGVLASPLLPPQDPWLSGYGISYYYFGYVMLAALIRLTGVLPEVGFNLGVAMWYALVMTAAFGVVYTLVALTRRPHPERSGFSEEAAQSKDAAGASAIGWGLLGAVMLGFMANLEGLIDTAYQRGLLPMNVINWFNIKGLTDSPATGDWTGGFWWWWRASRVIHDLTLPLNGAQNSVEVIDEFPFFSFLLGDLHPHVLGLPFVLLAVLFALNLLVGALSAGRGQEGRRDVAPTVGWRGRVGQWANDLAHATGLSWGGILLYAVVLGGIAFLNTWDFPIYLGLAALAFGVGIALRHGLNWRAMGGAVFALVALAVLSYLAYAPFYIGLQSQLGGILPNLIFPSRFSQFFIMFGPFLVISVAFLVLLCREAGTRATTRQTLLALPWTLLVPLMLVAVVVLGFAALPSGQAQVREILQQPEIAANVGDASLGGLLRLVVQIRAAAPWTYLVLAVLLAWAIGAVVAALKAEPHPSTSSGKPLPDSAQEAFEFDSVQDASTFGSAQLPLDLFAALMIVVALVLTLLPEFLYLRDIFGSRMNTVFKFYYQAWALLALASAYGLSRLAARTTPVALRVPAVGLAAVLIVGGLWYPLAAIPSKADNFQGEATLNGLAYIERSNPADMAAISWLRQNVRPDAVVLESMGGSYQDVLRVSMSTGNPTLLGWDFHERQWRGNAGYDKLAAMRPNVIEQIYRTAGATELAGLLSEWDVDYVYIGSLERSKYKVSDASMARFDQVMTRVYDADGVRIYAR